MTLDSNLPSLCLQLISSLQLNLVKVDAVPPIVKLAANYNLKAYLRIMD